MQLTLQQAMELFELSVFRASFYICKNRQDAEDICQETFLEYHSTRKSFEDEEHLKAWLLRVSINKSLNLSRSFWHKNRETLEDFEEALEQAPPEDSGLLTAVLELPKKCRVIIHLFYYEDYSVKEISQLLRVSENTVKSQLHRGRMLLKEKLKEGWSDDE